jgi:hypothetical protein
VTPALGIDIGRVIISAGTGRGDTSFLDGDLDSALRTPPTEAAIPSIAQLVGDFGGMVWLVSKAGPRVQDRTQRWLEHHRFWGETGVQRSRLRFCRQRAEKADIARSIGLTHFIDDRPDVLAPMAGLVQFRFLFGPQRHPSAGPILVPDWRAVVAAVHASLSPGRSGTGAERSR